MDKKVVKCVLKKGQNEMIQIDCKIKDNIRQYNYGVK